MESVTLDSNKWQIIEFEATYTLILKTKHKKES